MKRYASVIALFSLCLGCLTMNAVAAQDSETPLADDRDVVRAKIGIRITSDDSIRRAKSEDRIKAGDQLRIYIHPAFQDAMIYVLYHSPQQVIPLYHQQADKPPIILPVPDGSYTVDGQSPEEHLTIVCSPSALDELEDFLRAQSEERRSISKTWDELEVELLEKSKLDLSEDISKPWGIAGSLRSADPFLVHLPIFSGKHFIIKTYEFLVEE